MRIDAVELSDFRNFHNISFSPAPGLNVIAGANAQGKSNLLEGLSLLAVGRSFRGARPPDLSCWDTQGPAVLRGELHRGDAVVGLRRVVHRREDGVWGISGESCAWARVVPFAWQDLGIVHGGPQARRDFLDGFTGKLYPAHLRAWVRYRQVVARRNHLLQSGYAGGDGSARLEPWNEQVVQVGLELLARRMDAVAAIERELARVYPELAGRGIVRLKYRCSLGDSVSADRFRAALAETAREEARRGMTLAGPHRDDLAIELDGRDLRVFGSRGQQRLMALALRLAERRPVEEAVGSPPILLLDDALSELDPGARGRVLRHVADAGQVFLSTADRDLGEHSEAVWWHVSAGRITCSEMAAARGAA